MHSATCFACYVRLTSVRIKQLQKFFKSDICGDIAYCLVGYFILSHPGLLNSFKVTDVSTNRKTVCDFLLVINSK